MRTMTRFRWVICFLIFCAMTLNYVDRMVFGILAPELAAVFHWKNQDYTNIAFWFEVAYAIGLTCVGWIFDRIGTRRGFAFALSSWSVAAVMHAFMSTIAGFSVARFCLGLAESGAFPGAIKVTAEWFPQRERAFVTGVFNAGSNVGAVIAPLAVPWLFVTYGWQWAFIATGAVGAVWLLFWLILYHPPERHRSVSSAELAHIQQDHNGSTDRLPWLRLLKFRATWAFIVAKFFTDAVWRWYLYLLPLFFSQNFSLDIKNFGPPFLVIYLMADVGSIGGGGLSSWLLRRGWSVNAARKLAMLACALCVVPVAFAPRVSMWLAVFLVGLAASAHQGFSSNLFTTVSDMFPKRAVASVVGIGGTAGAIGAMVLLEITGLLFARHGLVGSKADLTTYTVLFTIASSAYLIALAAMHALVPRLAPVSPASTSAQLSTARP